MAKRTEWEPLNVRARQDRDDAPATVTRQRTTGVHRLNGVAFDLLGRPAGIEFVIPKNGTKLLGIRAGDPKEPEIYSAVVKGRAAEVSAKAVAIAVGFDLNGPSVRHEVELVDGVLVLDLTEPGKIVTRRGDGSQ